MQTWQRFPELGLEGGDNIARLQGDVLVVLLQARATSTAAEAVALGETCSFQEEKRSRALATQRCLHEQLLSGCLEGRARKEVGRVRMVGRNLRLLRCHCGEDEEERREKSLLVTTPGHQHWVWHFTGP